MIRGVDYTINFTVTNKGTGLPLGNPDLVNDIELVLITSISKVGLKRYKVGEGIEALEGDRYKLTIPRTHTLLLPPNGKAFLEGFTKPYHKAIYIDCGNIKDNAANRQTQGEGDE